MNTRTTAARAVCILTILFVSGCGAGNGHGDAAPALTGDPGASPATADISLLFMGNSHTSVNDLPSMVAAMVRAGRPARTVAAVVAPGWMFLEDRVGDVPTLNLLRSQNWSFVILQAQKYSSSGQFTYSTVEAEELVRLSRRQNAVPVLFPEWPRKNIPETQRIYDLHVSIARKEPACVAPIPQAWDLAMARHPDLILHDADGNHSAPAGAFLTALVLYATITGLSPADLPTLSQPSVDAPIQLQLRGIATETVQTIAPRLWCPGDRVAAEGVSLR
ncbi:MAG: hypothetical protein ABI790_08995 [Betaproteobacteria bacterium]